MAFWSLFTNFTLFIKGVVSEGRGKCQQGIKL